MINLIPVYIEGIKKLIAFVKLVPTSFSDCIAVVGSLTKLETRLFKYLDLKNWGKLFETIGETLMTHAFDLMGRFTEAFIALS
jgi:hypothetical protein